MLFYDCAHMCFKLFLRLRSLGICDELVSCLFEVLGCSNKARNSMFQSAYLLKIVVANFFLIIYWNISVLDLANLRS